MALGASLTEESLPLGQHIVHAAALALMAYGAQPAERREERGGIAYACPRIRFMNRIPMIR